jgi:hypothetical protein
MTETGASLGIWKEAVVAFKGTLLTLNEPFYVRGHLKNRCAVGSTILKQKITSSFLNRLVDNSTEGMS